MDMKVSGLDELSRKLNQQVPDVALKILRSAEKTAGRVIQDEAQRTVPVNTGHLRDNIIVSSKAFPSGILVQIGPNKKGWYGRFQEFGTKFVPALHWLQRAFDAAKDDALAAFIASAQKQLERLKSA